MGKFMKKRRGIGEVAVMEVSSSQIGVRTRARALAMAEATTTSNISKRSKFLSEQQFNFTSPQIRLRSRRQPEKSISPATSEDSGHVILANPFFTPNSDNLQVSRCSSNGSSELLNQSLRSVVDLEDSHEFENSPYTERTPSSELHSQSNNLDSSRRQSEMNSLLNSTNEEEKMPTDSEIEDFFSVAENAEKERFAERYNYDVEKDVPLEGRYEWIELKP